MANDAGAAKPDSLEIRRFFATLVFLGFGTLDLGRIPRGKAVDNAITEVLLLPWEKALVRARADAMETKDFSEVDRLKAALVAAGVEVRMSKAGVELVPGAPLDVPLSWQIGHQAAGSIASLTSAIVAEAKRALV